MKSQTFSNGILELDDREKWSLSKWTKFISITFFTEAVVLFFISFLLFLEKRTQGVDSFMVSGAFDGTTQLTFFIVINIAAAMFAVPGYYLYRYNNDHAETNDPEGHLRLYFKSLAITSVPLFFLLIAGILNFVYN